MTQTLQDLQTEAGAIFINNIPAHFGNDAAVIEQITPGKAGLCDRSHWGRIQVTGDDRLRFLHNQTTHDFNLLKSGQGCDTVFVTSTGRTIDLVTAYVSEDAVLLLVSPSYNSQLMEWMDRFIFFADKVELQDVTESTVAFSLLGNGLTAALGLEAIAQQPYASHQVMAIGGVEVRVARGSGLITPGYTLIAATSDAAQLWQTLTAAGAQPFGSQTWEQLRIQQGRPAAGQELTDAVNPLEAGLWQTISLSKGCYIGQETIARLHAYRGVKQQLWGIKMNAAAELDSLITSGEEKIGKLTSCTQTSEGHFGLAYIRTKAVTPGLKVTIGSAEGELVAVPFVSHEYP
ncbi:MAG: folate-binding protein YgfZ [Leptolyngbyaceae cyanobacterium CSU_1_4]|nr:folate-binding protein YgfZ [Leptolyngbyaceae cyanobacterium CSU_1_4]